MGLLGGWWGVAFVILVAALMGREAVRAMQGDVILTARQKVVRSLGGLLLMAVLLMALFSPVAVAPQANLGVMANGYRALLYWGACMGLAVLALVMAILDLGEIGREYARMHRDLRKNTLTREDVERLLSERKPDHPEDVGR